MSDSNYLFLDIMDKKEKKIEKIYSRGRIKIPKLRKLFCQTNPIFLEDNSKKKIYIRKIVNIVIVLCIAFLVVDGVLKAIEPVINAQCIAMAKSIATRISNEQATKVMADYQYDDLCNVVKDEDNNIKMISTNIINVNKIISDIPVLMQQELNQDENNKFYIKLGTFTGSKLFSGRGPDVEIKIASVGSVETDLKSEFESAGINQTLHRIYLEVRCKVTILTPFHTIEEQIVNQVLLAEGVIIGNIPDTYYNLEGLTQGQSLEVIH